MPCPQPALFQSGGNPLRGKRKRRKQTKLLPQSDSAVPISDADRAQLRPADAKLSEVLTSPRAMQRIRATRLSWNTTIALPDSVPDLVTATCSPAAPANSSADGLQRANYRTGQGNRKWDLRRTYIGSRVHGNAGRTVGGDYPFSRHRFYFSAAAPTRLRRSLRPRTPTSWWSSPTIGAGLMREPTKMPLY